MSCEEEQRRLLALWEASEQEEMLQERSEVSDEDAPSEHSRHDTDTAQSGSEYEQSDIDQVIHVKDAFYFEKMIQHG